MDSQSLKQTSNLRKEKRPIFLLCIVTTTFWTSLFVYLPIFSPYIYSLSRSISMVGLIVGSYGFTQLSLRIPLGLWSDRMGLRRPFILGGFLAAFVSGLGLAFTHNLWLILLFRSLTGIAATTWVTFTVLFSHYFPPERLTYAMGLITCCTSLGQLMATFSGGKIADKWGWLAPFYVSAAVAALGFIFALRLTEKPKRSSTSPKMKDLFSVVKTPLLLPVSFLAALGQYVIWVTVQGFIPIYAVNLGASKTYLGFLIMLSLLVYSLSAFLSGTWLTKIAAEGAIITIGFAIMAFTTAITPAIDSLSTLTISQAVFGIGRGMTYPILMGLSIRQVALERRATAMGLFQAIYALGMFIGPTISGFIGEFLGLKAVFLLTGAISSLAALIAIILIPRELK